MSFCRFAAPNEVAAPSSDKETRTKSQLNIKSTAYQLWLWDYQSESEMDTSWRIEKLNNTNYSKWKFKMRMILIKEQVWYAVDGSQPKGELLSSVPVEWLRADQLAKSLISLSVDDNQLYLIAHTVTSKEAWNALREFHEVATNFKRMRTIRILMDIKMAGNKTMEEHIAELSEYLLKLSDMDVIGFDHDAVRVTLLLTSLPESYNALVTALEMRPENELSWPFVTSTLIDEYHRRNCYGNSISRLVKVDTNPCRAMNSTLANCFKLRSKSTRRMQQAQILRWHKRAKRIARNFIRQQRLQW